MSDKPIRRDSSPATQDSAGGRAILTVTIDLTQETLDKVEETARRWGCASASEYLQLLLESGLWGEILPAGPKILSRIDEAITQVEHAVMNPTTRRKILIALNRAREGK